MADQRDDKSRFPLTGLFALLAMISGFLFYEGISLKTSRPINKEQASSIFLKKGIVQSRLWQDPFEAVNAHRLLEEKLTGEPDEKNDRHTLDKLVEVLDQSEISNLRVLPVFVDGSPYVNGGESRLNDRYAVVSALGATDYVPESGEYIRFFKWNRDKKNNINTKTGTRIRTGADEIETLIPAELYFPNAKFRDEPYGKHVLVLWLKEQDAGPEPLMFLDDLLESLEKAFDKHGSKITFTYDVLGPRSSATLSAMLKELQSVQPDAPTSPFNLLKKTRFFSPYATAEDTFLLDYSPNAPQPSASHRTGKQLKESGKEPGKNNEPEFTKETAKEIEKATVNGLLSKAQIKLIRTINTDAVLAEQLLRELKRRQVDLQPCADKHCNPQVALISEWDTLYGRALPRTFAAVAMNNGSGETGPALETEINKLRRDAWPGWIYRHSYLAGLDGELPARGSDKGSDKEKDGIPAAGKAWYGGLPQGPEQSTAQRPEGRGQLDYVIRLAAALKQEETRNGEEFKAIGVLGSDVYDKLLILQALRRTFPRAVFFTTDLNARLAYPAEWHWTHNLIIASHFGLELQPDLQTPIPPFRDSYQTSLFYSALWALEYFISADNSSCPDCFQLRKNKEDKGNKGAKKFSADAEPRLYEVGRHGAFDISTDLHPPQPDYASIHPPRRDLETYFDTERSLKWIVGAMATAAILVLGIMLISNTAAAAMLKLASLKWFWITLIVAGAAIYGAITWAMRSLHEVAKNEPLVLTEGISAWPTAAIGAFVLLMSLVFLWYSWRRLKNNEIALAHEFGLERPDMKGDDPEGQSRESQGTTPGGRLPDEPHRALPFNVFGRAARYLMGLETWHQQAPGHFSATHLWCEYTTLGDLKNFAARCLPQVAIALCFTWLMMTLFGFPNIPCRGQACFTINDYVIILSLAAMMLLIFYVIDVTLLCRRWVNCIAVNKIDWPDDTLIKIAREQGVSKENLDEWMGIELIAERTTVIGNFIYFPFIIMFLLGISRHSYLDNWDFPAALVIIFTLNAILIVGNALALRRSAEMAKREAIKRLESRLTQLSSQTSGEIKQRQQIEWAIQAIKNNQKGAFLPFTQHPIFGAAIALPSGGYGLVLLLEYLATSF
ncbi:hypothetical protein [Nitrosovibrio tenuis]|uniref:Uncharacterized protein n=1 Tax=Nitrosovibrio tenuis TaxID=1233 RepID=A0A1H7NK87_9PROT|nr:hypothetical protein [Nitrosovibrio tenuis]SEL23903.1 hypothetical protein SAMN05216387_10750 [Nitrosovibrio tenuis]